MTATERLRTLLDERGVEWEGTPGVTFWGNCSALDVTANSDEKVSLHLCCTPEQAIAATLGSEREKQLERLVNQLWYLVNHRSGYGYAAALEAIEELGIEVDE